MILVFQGESIEGNFQLNDVARQTLLSILKSDCLFLKKL